jgi:hypothetical protein
LKNVLTIETKNGKSVKIGKIESEYTHIGKDDNVTYYEVFNAADKLHIYEDGHISGTSARFESSYFEGEINATYGSIGGLAIEEWKNMQYSVKVTSSNGFVLKVGDKTTLTATFYKGTAP